jgi:hypothetical protein
MHCEGEPPLPPSPPASPQTHVRQKYNPQPQLEAGDKKRHEEEEQVRQGREGES